MPYINPLLGSLNLTPEGKTGEAFQAEISTYVAFPGVGKLYTISSGGGSTLQVVDATSPKALKLIQRLDLSDYVATSVASHRALIAVALSPSSYDVSPSKGLVRFYKVSDKGGLTKIGDVSVGYLPDSVAFSPKGDYVIVANEAQPSTDYSSDPEGSIGVVKIGTDSSGSTFSYTDLAFTASALPSGFRFEGPTKAKSVSDIEPEYVFVDGSRAYVTLQENNAVAIVDYAASVPRIESIHVLGDVDFSTLSVDLSDKDGASGAKQFLPKLKQQFKGKRMPDGIAAFTARGETFYITANEGDAREYTGFEDVARHISAPNGRLKTLKDPLSGATTALVPGSRSISIFKAVSGELVWDSGVDLQHIAQAANTYDDDRSDDKGVEPENVIVAMLNGRAYAIASLERGSKTTIAVFDVSNPKSVNYVSHVTTSGISPEGLKIVPANQSPTNTAQLLVSNEVSNSIDIIDLGILIKNPGSGSAGFFTKTMLRDVAGGPALNVSNLITNGEFTKSLPGAGEAVYRPTGIFDGLGAYDNRDGTFTILANSELGITAGDQYTVNGVSLTGARVHKFIVDKDLDDDSVNGFQSAILSGGIAYKQIIDAKGQVLEDASQINGGFARFCSSSFERPSQFGKNRGFKDAVFLTAEEADEGLMYALDTRSETMYALPGLGRAGWETAIGVDTGHSKTIAVLLMDDNTAPIYLWVGQKSGTSFLERNGLAASQGSLYTWVPGSSMGQDAGTSGVPDSADLNDLPLGATAQGTWALLGSGTEIAALDESALRNKAFALGALQLSRLEDANINPVNGKQVVFATTGNTAFGGADTFGNLIRLDLTHAFDSKGLIAASSKTGLSIIYDGDRELKGWEARNGNGNGQLDTVDERVGFGATIIRNPDGLTWSADGFIYVQEDRSVAADYFKQQEASIWKVNPGKIDAVSGQVVAERWLQMDRTAIPASYGQSDGSATDYGNWESSGIIDLSRIYGTAPGAVFLADVQAHSLTNGNIAGSGSLVQGGQITLIQDPNLI